MDRYTDATKNQIAPSSNVVEALEQYAKEHGVEAATLLDAIVLEWLVANTK